jgi:hypothetical protein
VDLLDAFAPQPVLDSHISDDRTSDGRPQLCGGQVDFLDAYVLQLIDRPGQPVCAVEKFLPGNYVKVLRPAI